MIDISGISLYRRSLKRVFFPYFILNIDQAEKFYPLYREYRVIEDRYNEVSL